MYQQLGPMHTDSMEKSFAPLNIRQLENVILFRFIGFDPNLKADRKAVSVEERW